jgi:hypothetical protein
VILFDGKDLSAWQGHPSSITKAGEAGPPEWKLENGYFEVVPKTGDLATKEKFGDCQLHVEWQERPDITGTSQGRGNSGVLLMGRYEIQVLDSYQSKTYADGQAGAIYGQWPPLANAVRKPGEWNVYAEIRRREAGEAGLLHGLPEWSAAAQQERIHGSDGLPAGGPLCAATGGGFTGATEP